jgi:GNAT superfamily N-acetyltransferase
MTEIVLPPDYASYIWRPYTWDDMAAVAYLIRQEDLQVGLTNYQMSEEEMREEFLGDFSFEESTRLLQAPNGEVVARVEVWDKSEPPVRIFTAWSVLPEHMGKGLEPLLLAWAENRARKAFSRCPDDARVVLQSGTVKDYRQKEAPLEAAGYERVRYFYRMKIDMAEAPAPVSLSPDLSIRTFHYPDELEAFCIARRDGWRDHWGYVEQPLDVMAKQYREWFDNDSLWTPEMCFLAVERDTDAIAAVCNCRMEEWGDPSVGYVATLFTRPAHRGKGVALAMLRHAFGAFWARGKRSVALHVDASSLTGAVRLYEKAGMHIDVVETTYERVLREGRELMTRTLPAT